MDADKLVTAHASRDRGESHTKIAKALGISRASIYRHRAATSSEQTPATAQPPAKP